MKREPIELFVQDLPQIELLINMFFGVFMELFVNFCEEEILLVV